MASRRAAKYALVIGGSAALGYGSYKTVDTLRRPQLLMAEAPPLEPINKKALPSRAEQLTALKEVGFD